jgi:DNA-binding response OmpR family regulator
VLLDIWMPDVDGITLLKEWGASGQLTMPVIMMSGHGTIDTAVEATKFGAMAFLEKPITLQKLLRAVEQALARTRRRRLRPAPPTRAGGPGAVAGRSAADARRHARRDAQPLAPRVATCDLGYTLVDHAMVPAQMWPRCPSARRATRASNSTARCARRATPSRSAISSSTSPRRTAR